VLRNPGSAIISLCGGFIEWLADSVSTLNSAKGGDLTPHRRRSNDGIASKRPFHSRPDRSAECDTGLIGYRPRIP